MQRDAHGLAISTASAKAAAAFNRGGRVNLRIHTHLFSALIAIAAIAGFAIFSPAADASENGQGVVSFANSGSPAAQTDFLSGLAELHNFQYRQAAEAFRRAEALDANFAMAYWGEAMTYNQPVWQEQDLRAARAALAKLGATPEARAAKAGTPREKAYLHAVEILYGDGEKDDRDRRYALAMEQLHASYPDDVDATCLYALALLGTSHAARDVPTYMRAAALLEEAFEQHPRHPGAAHYLIHSVDNSVHAPLGLRAARAYSKIAPDSPHAQHMPSHIFLALGMWDDVVASNEAALGIADLKGEARDQALRRLGCGHTITWLAYAYLQQGRFADARTLLESCAEEARQKRPTRATGAELLDYDSTSAGSFSAMRTRHLVDSGDWSGDLDIDVSGVVAAEFTRDFADAYRAARYGKMAAAVEAVKRAEASGRRFVAAATAAGIPAESATRRVPIIERDELNGVLLLRQHRTARGLALLAKAAAAEKAIPMEFGPPSLDKPANELLGEVLLELHRAPDARTAFEAAQVLAPGRGQSLIGLSACARMLKDSELAQSVDARLAKVGLREALGAKSR